MNIPESPTPFASSDDERLLAEQIASASHTPTKKSKRSGSSDRSTRSATGAEKPTKRRGEEVPEPTRPKRTKTG